MGICIKIAKLFDVIYELVASGYLISFYVPGSTFCDALRILIFLPSAPLAQHTQALLPFSFAAHQLRRSTQPAPLASLYALFPVQNSFAEGGCNIKCMRFCASAASCAELKIREKVSVDENH